MILAACSMYIGAAQCRDFCDGAKFVAFDDLVANRDSYLDRQVKTRAILKTDLKEYTQLRQSEASSVAILVGWDAEFPGSATVIQSSQGSDLNPSSILRDYYVKLRNIGISNKDRSKLRFYRQVRLLCGRVRKAEPIGYRFVIDDSVLERSYLIDWIKPKTRTPTKFGAAPPPPTRWASPRRPARTPAPSPTSPMAG
ncbi:MAG: hypothetical protein JSR74_00745 [Proteobacteria bacterium]|nr:hypothetical protein [Pseudomonadota bacterium]